MTLRSHSLDQFHFAPRLPGDKSITHRAVLLGALATGESVLENPNPGSDCAATRRGTEALGARWTVNASGWRIEGLSGAFRAPTAALDLGNSGTGLRLLAGLLAAQPFEAVLEGDASLSRRPMERVLAPLRRMGARGEAPGDHPPVRIHGGPLTGLRHHLDRPSAQVKSALLLAGIQAQGTTWVGGVRGTRDHTERLLRAMGAEVAAGDDWVSVLGGQPLTGARLRIPGDLSAGVFYLVAAAICPGSEVVLEDVGLNPTRTPILDVLGEMGLRIEVTPSAEAGEEPTGRLRAWAPQGLRGFEVGPERVPWMIDELPALAVAGAFAQGRSRLGGAAELKVKESDRLRAMAEGLTALGARVTLSEDGWILEGTGGEPIAGGNVPSRGDHRVAMALLVAGFRSRGGVRITDPGLLETSDPYFADNLRDLGEPTS